MVSVYTDDVKQNKHNDNVIQSNPSSSCLWRVTGKGNPTGWLHCTLSKCEMVPGHR